MLLNALSSRVVFAALLSLATLLEGALIRSEPVRAQVPPASFYGTAVAGDTIEARHNDVACAEATAGAEGFWTLRVSGGGACGVSEGGTLAFFRNGVDSGARETFRPGGVPSNIAGGVNTVGDAPRPAPAPPVMLPARAFSGETPTRGAAALLVTSRETSPQSLRIALGETGCAMESMAVLRDGAWAVFIEGAPPAVNARFPLTLPPSAAFFVRC